MQYNELKLPQSKIWLVIGVTDDVFFLLFKKLPSIAEKNRNVLILP